VWDGPEKVCLARYWKIIMKRDKSWLEIEKKSRMKTEEVGDILSAETLLERRMVSKANLYNITMWCKPGKHYACSSGCHCCVCNKMVCVQYNVVVHC